MSRPVTSKPPLIKRTPQRVQKRKGKAPRRRASVLPYVVMFVIVALIPLGRHLIEWGTRWGYLTVKRIEITGNSRISSEQIKMWTGIKEGLNMLNFDLDGVTGIAEAQPWIRSLLVERRFPYTVSIEVEEKLPVAIWEEEDNRFLMDEFGCLLEPVRGRDSFSSLPVMTCFGHFDCKAGRRCPFPYWSNGLSMVEIMKECAPEFMNEVVKICIVSEDQVTVFLTQGRKLLVDMETIRAKFPLLKALIRKMPEQWRSMGYCDVRFDNKIIFG
ncbi:MAG: cell division protein FtsQ/DivIB [bacterium]